MGHSMYNLHTWRKISSLSVLKPICFLSKLGTSLWGSSLRVCSTLVTPETPKVLMCMDLSDL